MDDRSRRRTGATPDVTRRTFAAALFGAVVAGCVVVIVGSVVVTRIGRSTIAVRCRGRLGPEAGPRPADRRGPSVIRPTRVST